MYPVPGCQFWPPTEMKHIDFFFHLWPEKLSQSSLPSPDLEDKNLPLLPPPGERAVGCPQRAFSTGGNWILVFLSPPAAPLCSLCWRCHHQRSNKAKATSAFSESLFTEMTSHSAPNTLGYSLTGQVASALSELDRSLKAQVIGYKKRNWKHFCRGVFSKFHLFFLLQSESICMMIFFPRLDSKPLQQGHNLCTQGELSTNWATDVPHIHELSLYIQANYVSKFKELSVYFCLQNGQGQPVANCELVSGPTLQLSLVY